MANQDPQPEIYQVTAAFPVSTTAGTTSTTNITTSQANNEEVRIYALQLALLDENGGDVLNDPSASAAIADVEFNCAITVGANNVPSQTFSLTPTLLSDSKILTFPSPILVLYQYPLQVVVTCVNALAAGSGAGRTVVCNMISELALQKVAGTYTDSDFPRSR
jgi:hypothetical protein|tara:strand:- start:58 stop:546 length:489 start_codon:yes stop_codon:yes gene_type:complete